MPATARPCPACTRPRAAGHYLCWRCWHALPADTRQALNRRDSHAMRRLQQLLAEITAGTPLADIHLSRDGTGTGGDPCAS
jgi:hypothetical protein